MEEAKRQLREQLCEQLERNLKWLEELADKAEEDEGEAIEEFLKYTLEIRRVQYFSEDSHDWETLYYEFLLTYGGPTIWITSNSIRGTWSPVECELCLPEKVERFICAVENYISGWDECLVPKL